jgi:hypothetical protein
MELLTAPLTLFLLGAMALGCLVGLYLVKTDQKRKQAKGDEEKSV